MHTVKWERALSSKDMLLVLPLQGLGFEESRSATDNQAKAEFLGPQGFLLLFRILGVCAIFLSAIFLVASLTVLVASE